MQDRYGRKFTKLRLNLLDACNMRCLYCMPENQTFSNLENSLSVDEIKSITQSLSLSGIEEIRITGGEPLLHPKFKQIVNELSKLSLKKLGLTTNAILLDKYIPFLKESNITHINISLDSLKEASFKFITKRDCFHKVLDNILLAKANGFIVKINMVMMKNLNFEEIEDFLKFSSDNDIEVRFLEMMKVGHGIPHFDRHFVSADDAIKKIKKGWNLKKMQMPKDSTSFNYMAGKENMKANIGFIASETKPFCSDCSRLRLTNKGVLRPCMMVNEGVSVNNKSDEDLKLTLQELIYKKPNYRIEQNPLTMNEIGG
ncbi:MAG: GTP 3',8-cyclase MoaA [Bacteriovoracaceae bacterium]|jgi:cyclic pyranopterin phosphate synthase|nr:GTP 3',8-cyclase MoaA [Bacteriovoracaceae bacterium]